MAARRRRLAGELAFNELSSLLDDLYERGNLTQPEYASMFRRLRHLMEDIDRAIKHEKPRSWYERIGRDSRSR